LAAVSYGLRISSGEAVSKSITLMYQGNAMPLADCLAAMEAKSLFLMLGLNDGVPQSVEASIKRYAATLDRVLARNPDIKIFVQSCTPVAKAGEKQSLNNVLVDVFNEALRKLCDERGVGWVDVNAALKDEGGALRREYTSDNYVHMSNAGCAAWIDALRAFARERYIANEWAPPAP
jgi:lysophospholipase L1-like esterase